MRSLKDTLLTSNKDKKQQLEENYTRLVQIVLALEAQLIELNASIRDNRTADITVIDEQQSLMRLIEKTKAYLAVIPSCKKLGIHYNKMSDTDLAVLDNQVVQLTALHQTLNQFDELLTNDSLRSFSSANGESVYSRLPDTKLKLSEQIDETCKMEYSVSYKTVWLRRAKLIAAAALSAAILVAGVCVLMTPGVNIVAALTMVPTMFSSALAFFYLRKPAMAHSSVNMLGTSIPLSTAVPSTLGIATTGLYGLSLVRKLAITNPPREVAARVVAAENMGHVVTQLRKQVTNSVKNTEEKAALSDKLAQGEKLYFSGVNSWFHELRTARMKKGASILCAVASAVESQSSL